MLPYISIGRWEIASYSLMALLGFVVALCVAIRIRRRYAIEMRDLLCAMSYGVFGLVIGAKIFYAIPYIPEMLRDLITTGDIRGGRTNGQFFYRIFSGYVFYGGLLGMMAGVRFYAKAMRMEIGYFMNVLALVIPVFHGFGRIGCYMAGCCYGRLIPVQLVEAFCNFLLAVVLYRYGKKYRMPYHIMACYLMGYPVVRFVLEIFRADRVRGVLTLGGLELSVSQVISVVLFCVGFCMYKRSLCGKEDCRIDKNH